MNYMRPALLGLFNIILFIAIQYFSLLSAFLLGMEAADYYRYESLVYIPGILLHLIVLIILFIKHNRKTEWSFGYLISILIVLILVIMTRTGIIPYHLIPS